MIWRKDKPLSVKSVPGYVVATILVPLFSYQIIACDNIPQALGEDSLDYLFKTTSSAIKHYATFFFCLFFLVGV